MKIQVSACVHQESPDILAAWLDGLAALDTTGIEVSHRFVLHNPVGYETGMIEEKLPGALVKALKTDVPSIRPSDYTHEWRRGIIEIVSAAKNDLIREALESGADYILFNDSDQVLQPPTLRHLLAQDKDIIGPISWTRWTPDQPELPNVWDFDHYTIKRGSLELWRKPGVYPVGFIGGCLLIHRRVLEAGVRYERIPNLLFVMEDRWFNIRAAVLGFQAWVSTHYPYFHIYRNADLARLDNWRKDVGLV